MFSQNVYYHQKGWSSQFILIPPQNVRTMATLCEQVLSQVFAYNIGFRLPTLAYGQLVVGDINNQRRAISYSTDTLLSKNNLKQVVTRLCV